jgi:hypothetical protein
MKTLIIKDLARTEQLDGKAMAAVRGGTGLMPDVSVNVALNQQFAQVQQVGVSVLNNNGVIGAAFGGLDMQYAADEWKSSHAM